MALVLARRQGEKIWIGDACMVIVAIRGREVVLAIDAPADVPIAREEILAANDVRRQSSPAKRRPPCLRGGIGPTT